MELIQAIKKDEALVKEMDNLLAGEEGFHIWWLGQSGFLLQWNGRRVLLDPYLSDSLTMKYAATEKPHTRMSERVIDPALLSNISIVTSSHNHTDHLDAETLAPILKNNPGIKLIIPFFCVAHHHRAAICPKLISYKPLIISNIISVSFTITIIRPG